MIIAIVKEINHSWLFDKILQLHHELFIPFSVYDELLDSDSKNKCDELINNEKLEICRLNTKSEIKDFQKSYPYLGKGECDAMLQLEKLTKNGKEGYCILDDKRARRVAESRNIRYTGLLGLLKLLECRDIITTNEYDESVTKLQGSNFRTPKRR
jgi:predicted nucleic acid-binding protein